MQSDAYPDPAVVALPIRPRNQSVPGSKLWANEGNPQARSKLLGAYLINPPGREAVFAGCAAGYEERRMAIPYKRRMTQLRARKVASRLGFAPSPG